MAQIGDNGQSGNPAGSAPKESPKESHQKALPNPSKSSSGASLIERLWAGYFRNYKKILIFPFILLFVSLMIIGLKIYNEGEFIDKDISLKGGVSITILLDKAVDIASLQALLEDQLSPNEVSVRSLRRTGSSGILIESDVTDLDDDTIQNIMKTVSTVSGEEIRKEDYTAETVGSSLGQSFFSQLLRALLFASVFIAIVVFLCFRTPVPSAAVILAAFSDMATTVAALDLFGIKVGSAGIAALLMLIGYSIDTDIMLTTKVLRRRDQSIHDAVRSAFNTGIMMSLTVMAAAIIGFIFTDSEVIRQIMMIVVIGMIADMIYTWLQNAGLLVWYTERK